MDTPVWTVRGWNNSSASVPAISLTRGALQIEFRGAADLAAKLLELSQAMANDWSAFMRADEKPGSGNDTITTRSAG